MTRALSILVLLTLGLLMLGLAACSSQEAPVQPSTTEDGPAPGARQSITPSPSVADTPVASAIEDGDPRRGGRLLLASMVDVPHLDVHQSGQETLAVLGPGLAYSRLLRLSAGPEIQQPSLTLECDLCESWDLASDMSYVFRLRPDVYWQDIEPVNGRPLVADDLDYSYARMRTPGWPGAARFEDRGIGVIEAVDDHTLKVNLEFRDADALLALADGHSKIVAPEVVEQFGSLKQAPVIGTGPWVYEEASSDGATEFVRNPQYFEPGLPYLDGITVKVVGTPSDADAVNPRRLALYRAGQIDVIVVPTHGLATP